MEYESSLKSSLSLIEAMLSLMECRSRDLSSSFWSKYQGQAITKDPNLSECQFFSFVLYPVLYTCIALRAL